MGLLQPTFKAGDVVMLDLANVFRFCREPELRRRRGQVGGIVVAANSSIFVGPTGATDVCYRIRFDRAKGAILPDVRFDRLEQLWIPGVFLDPDPVTGIIRSRRFKST